MPRPGRSMSVIGSFLSRAPADAQIASESKLPAKPRKTLPFTGVGSASFYQPRFLAQVVIAPREMEGYPRKDA